MQFTTYELFAYGIFHLIFLEYNLLWVRATWKAKSCIREAIVSQVLLRILLLFLGPLIITFFCLLTDSSLMDDQLIDGCQMSINKQTDKQIPSLELPCDHELL